jgi:DHA1 family bicyclomycin/chloramphenicol resistance-like MFS transporter
LNSSATKAVQPSPIIPAILIAASSISVMTTDLYAPSLPHLPAIFDTDAKTVQQTMIFNLLGYALGQLVHGPMSERFGRRPVMIGGMGAAVIFSLACALAWSIDALIVARTFQGLAVCAEAVIALAVIRDVYDGPSGARILAVFGMSIAIVPAIAPVIGGFIHVWLGWRANFFLLTFLALVVTVLVWRFLPETTIPDREALKPKRLVGDYVELFTHRGYMCYALSSGAALGALFVFITEGPFLFIDRLGVRTEYYGFSQATIVTAFFFGSLFANRYVRRLGVERLLQYGLVFILVGGLMLPGTLVLGWESTVPITASISVYAFALGLFFASAPMRALEEAPGGGGSAAALLGSLEMGGGALAVAVAAHFHDGTAWPMAGTFAASAVLTVLFYVVIRPRRAISR